MMTIDEAITHAEWCADNSCGECSEEHRQLAEWLRELRERRRADVAALEDERNILLSWRLGDYKEFLRDARAENEQYRELIRILDHDWNIEASWDGLRKFWYVGLTEKGVAERDERDAENAKMRELVQDYDKVLSSMNALCDCDFVPLCDGTLLALRSRMYELGIEVS